MESERRDEASRSAAAGAFTSLRARADGSYDVPYATASVGDIFGSSPAQIASDPEGHFWGRVHADDRDRVTRDLDAAGARRGVSRNELRVQHPVRGEQWVEMVAGPQREPDGKTVFHCFMLDITERKRLERELAEERDRIAGIAASSPGALCAFHRAPDGTTSFPFASDAMGDIYGVPVEEIRRDAGRALSRIHPDDLPRVNESIEQSARTMQPWRCEFRVNNPMRGELWVEGHSQPLRAPDGGVVWNGVVTEITERRRTAELHRQLIELLPDALFVHKAGHITLCNAAFVRLMGATSADQLIGSNPLHVVHPDDRARVLERLAVMTTTGRSVPPAEACFVALDGGLRRVRVVATPIDDEAAPTILAIAHDITERQRTERLLASVLESVSDAIVTIDAEGVIRAVNPAVSRVFGYAPEELVGADVTLLMPPPYAAEHALHLAKHGQRPGATSTSSAREVSARRKDGTTFPIELSVTGFELDGAPHFTGVIRDVTERKKLEEQFRQAHKMEAFGQLAGGVAHDFNNLLTVILGETEVLLSSLPPSHPSVEPLTAVFDAGERAAGLTRQLLAFSRKTVLEPRVVDINGVVRETEKMLRRLIGEDVRISTKLMPNLRHVNVDPSQLAQVLMNLAVNARDAMPTGGTLALETKHVDVDRGEALHDLPPGAYVQLTVRDSGVGMSPGTLERIFQPFFTTKGPSRGTGLGLAVVHGIVQQSGGHVEVTSAEGRGTSFDIWLPAARTDRPPAERDAIVPDVPAKGALLLVEDDDAVRRLATRALSAKGYDVAFARDGAEALAVVELRGLELDLVITDVVLPDMSGRDLKERLGARNPGLRVLYASGYTDDMLALRGVRGEGANFLAKPYTPTSLLQAVRRMLAS